jgi:DNA polymerase elongation subunit (family B)
MASCVIDIETCALDDDQIAPALVEKLEGAAEDDEDWREALGLYALGASVVTIGLYSPETGRAAMLYDDRHGLLDTIEAPPRVDQVKLVGADERALLREFWGMVKEFGTIVSYNGRGFDVPFLLQRSLIHGVDVSRNLMPPRFSSMREHMDLAELLSQFRATRPYGLEAWSQALGIQSPKEGEVKGAGVSAAFRAGRIQEIVEYCLRDVVATAEIAVRICDTWGKAMNLPAIRFAKH